MYINIERDLYVQRQRKIYYAHFSLLWRHCLLGDTVCTEQSVLIKYQKADKPIYLRLCNRCSSCLHMTLCFLRFWTIYAIYPVCQQADQHYPPTLSMSGSMPTSSGQGISLLATLFLLFFFLFCNDYRDELMVCTGCDGYAVCLSSFMLSVPIRSFLYGTLKE